MEIFNLWCYLSITIISRIECAKILGIFQYPSKSHHILGKTLLKGLAAKGHQTTLISPFPPESQSINSDGVEIMDTKSTNYEEIQLTNMLQFKEETVFKNSIELVNTSVIDNFHIFNAMIDKVTEIVFTNPPIKTLLASNRTFDLLILSYCTNEAYLAISHHFRAQTIAFSTFGASFFTNYITRNPEPYSYIPFKTISFPDGMNFIQRVANTLLNMGYNVIKSIITKEETYRQTYFPNAPPTHEMVKKISLVLLNSHYSIESPRLHVPTMLQIGGFHIDEPKPLEEDIKSFMDSAKKGVIFFSLGTNIKSSDLPEPKLKAILKCFSKLPLNILWKFENKTIKNLPPNVKIGIWLPQRDILAHPNIKLFISHGGLLSTTEAIYSGVPIVGIPVFVDQATNIDQSVKKGYALKLPFQELSEETLTKAIKEILNNPKYRDNIKKRSIILRDQPMKPIDLAAYWVKYVLRHKGLHYLKTDALKLEWYQYFLLDVIAFLLGVLILVISITNKYIIWLVVRCKHAKRF